MGGYFPVHEEEEPVFEMPSLCCSLWDGSVEYQQSTFSLLHLHGRFLSSFTHQLLFDLHQPWKLKVAALHLVQG